MTQEKNLRAKWRPHHFAISTFSLGAGITPAQGSVKPTAGFTLNCSLHSLLTWRRGGSSPPCGGICYQGWAEAVVCQEVFGDQHQREQLNRRVADYGRDFSAGDRGAHLVGPVVTRVGD